MLKLGQKTMAKEHSIMRMCRTTYARFQVLNRSNGKNRANFPKKQCTGTLEQCYGVRNRGEIDCAHHSEGMDDDVRLWRKN
jgi:uncharacterized membrane protein